jgi:hypothetical protein
MSFARQLARGLRALWHPAAAEQDLSDEVNDYLEEATASFVASGLSLEEARRAARLQYGHASALRDQVRASGWEQLAETMIADADYAARRLRRAPGFTALAVITLGLGIGASTAIFSAVKPILLAALPYPDADRILVISDVGAGGEPLDVTLFEAFGLVALFLAATGIYGVLSGSVTERTREIGLRAALGASRSNVVGLVIRQALTVVSLGMASGLAAAAAASPLVTTLLFGVSPLDPVTYAGVTTLLLTVAGVACSVPAWRAARVEPATALRAQ